MSVENDEILLEKVREIEQQKRANETRRPSIEIIPPRSCMNKGN